jgi:hypothetical protein
MARSYTPPVKASSCALPGERHMRRDSAGATGLRPSNDTVSLLECLDDGRRASVDHDFARCECHAVDCEVPVLLEWYRGNS